MVRFNMYTRLLVVACSIAFLPHLYIYCGLAALQCLFRFSMHCIYSTHLFSRLQLFPTLWCVMRYASCSLHFDVALNFICVDRVLWHTTVTHHATPHIALFNIMQQSQPHQLPHVMPLAIMPQMNAQHHHTPYAQYGIQNRIIKKKYFKFWPPFETPKSRSSDA